VSIIQAEIVDRTDNPFVYFMWLGSNGRDKGLVQSNGHPLEVSPTIAVNVLCDTLEPSQESYYRRFVGKVRVVRVIQQVHFFESLDLAANMLVNPGGKLVE
jgi:hypothetical protein